MQTKRNSVIGWKATVSSKKCRYTPNEKVVMLHKFPQCSWEDGEPFEVAATNNRLLELVRESPPPQQWFDGEEEDLF